MSLAEKKELITQITLLLSKLIEQESSPSKLESDLSKDKPLEMLTIKECAALVDGLSENTVRQLCAQGKITHVRAGAGRNGKILVSKVSLLKYLGIAG